MNQRRWSPNRVLESGTIGRGDAAALVFDVLRWLVTILLSYWGYC